MKKIPTLLLTVAAIFFSSLAVQSCLDDNDNSYNMYYPNAIVTVKPYDNGEFFLQLNDSVAFSVANLAVSPYGTKEVRAFINFSYADNNVGSLTRKVNLNWMDSILTKKTVITKEAEDDALYGKDPIDIYNDWMTVSEDGYLTLHFRIAMGAGGVKHSVNLVTGVNPENPYEVEFRHDANHDDSANLSDGIVAFKLSSLPDTHGLSVKLKVDWKSSEGDKSEEFDYRTPRDYRIYYSEKK
ncbi:MAG: NigD-like protein [Bacteroidales bacterium]|jgi:hypothetical protein|nr:NigD-like protein [Bacteroidales bacterium]